MLTAITVYLAIGVLIVVLFPGPIQTKVFVIRLTNNPPQWKLVVFVLIVGAVASLLWPIYLLLLQRN